jgi:lipoprotein NlpI
MENVWKLIESDRFNEAIAYVDKEFEQRGDFTNFGNKIIALLSTKQYDEVINTAVMTIYLKQKANPLLDVSSDKYLIYCCIALLFLNKKEEAIEQLLQAEKCKYTDAGGGIELYIIEYFVATKTSDLEFKKHAIKNLKRKLKKKQSLNWPGPLGNYLIGEIDEEKAFQQISKIPVLRERHLSQLNFVSAIKCFERGEIADYERKLKDTVSYGPMTYVECVYHIAIGELDSLGSFAL